MALNDPDIGALFGALDSAAFGDGTAFNAHHLRALARSAHRLLTKPQQVACLVWPLNAGVGDGETPIAYHGLSVAVPPEWTRILAPIPISKRPGLTRADIRVTAQVTDTFDVLLQFATRERPFNPLASPTDPNVMVLAGDGTLTHYALSNAASVRMARGDAEDLEVYARAPAGTSIATVGGGPYDHDGLIGIPGQVLLHGRHSLGCSNTSWVESTSTAPNFVNGGAVIEFFRGADGAEEFITRRRIIQVKDLDTLGYRQIFWAPDDGHPDAIHEDEYNDLMNAIAVGANAWRIVGGVRLDATCISVVCMVGS